MSLGGVHFTSGKDNWATPKTFFNRFDNEYKFKLDACAEAWNAKCLDYYSEIDNGLCMPWKSWTWCNPPYSDIRSWYEKAVEEMKLGNSSVLLTFARTDTKAFHEFALQASEIVFIQGRLKFVCPETKQAKHPAPSPSIAVIFDASKIGQTKFSTMRS